MTLLARGVHRCPVLSREGHPVFVSVDHNHCEVQRMVLMPGENPYDISAALWEHLDTVDPEHSRRGGLRLENGGLAHVPLIAAMGMALHMVANMPFFLFD